MMEENLISKTYDSGFVANIILKPGFASKFMGIVVDFGGSDPQEISGGAHFLEHKLFAKKYGDIALKFERLGADCNAYTGFNETMYYAEFANHWPKILPLLFELVGEPYFTVDNIDQERKIICQELATAKDDPEWYLIHNLMSNMFPQTMFTHDIVGSEEDLAKIDISFLNKIYKKYYCSNNMRFIACGDFSPSQVQKIFTLVNKMQKKYINCAPKPKIAVQTIDSMATDEQITNNKSKNIHVGVAIKLPDLNKFTSNALLATDVLEMLIDAHFNSNNIWLSNMQLQNIINDQPDVDIYNTREGSFVIITALSRYPQKLVSAIKHELFRGHMSAELIELNKKEFLANYLRLTDDLNSYAQQMAGTLLHGRSLAQIIEEVVQMNNSDMVSLYQDILAKSSIYSCIMSNR
ncbi:M16 family metallopeptidase [Lactobacillus iners]|jgi:peptidase, M16 family|uniref:M16 family metallopeptidase n=1 Tax=Lactobacillus iners TaxID=147802 RepID=UPI0001E5DD9B|nr:pitrilysin family protein [Lactobacillus iners]EFO71719.1 peptidase, M16 family [Lactobacillus iners SPIN 2503V10-D]MCT7717766.1 insulinase family protein [Lactobacillus iners]MCT7718954.1 insulinase family protein [Lactobacillus iners]MCT7723152.1 insulinase family protein [Lactobacillus iners]MCT7771341.1 insulinase family protein [Lactobacillus iners]